MALGTGGGGRVLPGGSLRINLRGVSLTRSASTRPLQDPRGVGVVWEGTGRREPVYKIQQEWILCLYLLCVCVCVCVCACVCVCPCVSV